MNNLAIGGIFNILAQILTFIQLQGNVKYGWYEKYPLLLLSVSIPISWLYIKSVKYFVLAFDGEIWPSRIIGFVTGMIVFTVMSYFLFSEGINLKTGLSILLSVGIILVQLLLK